MSGFSIRKAKNARIAKRGVGLIWTPPLVDRLLVISCHGPCLPGLPRMSGN